MGLSPVTRFVVSKVRSAAGSFTRAARLKPSGLALRARRPVQLTQVFSNDPVQRITAETSKAGAFRISGVAINRGFVPSFASLVLDGKAITTPLSGGMTPKHTADAIARKLPFGYALELKPLGAAPDADVLATVVAAEAAQKAR